MARVGRVLAALLCAVALCVLAGCAGGSGTSGLDDADIAIMDEAIGQEGQAGPGQGTAPEGAGPEAAQPPAEEPPATQQAPSVKLDDIDDNVFLDALAYTGYNLDKHRADGLMWEYVAWTDKGWRGWLSGITYGAGSTGYETDAAGQPDLESFRSTGLVCASYAAYVYFNYLPNVAGVDTSMLERPSYSQGADSWYDAAKSWVASGYSRNIGFGVEENANWLTFTPEEEIPIGSLIFFTDAKNPSDTASHIAVFAGYTNGYHWLIHVGNENGPEFCAVERMHFGPDPQWPIAVITRPDIF